MLLSSCPRCLDSIRIPASAREESVIRCPRCREEFSLGEVLAALPPEAEIVSGPGVEGHLVFPTDSADETDYALAEAVEEPKTDFQFKNSGPLTSDPPMAKIDSTRPSRKPKKAEPNMAIEFAKIIVGGASGLLIAVLMIMWFGHQDVFQVVPKLPVQAYFLVPEELRTSEMKEFAAKNSPRIEGPEEIEVEVETIPIEADPVKNKPVKSEGNEGQVSNNEPAVNEENTIASAFQESKNASEEEPRFSKLNVTNNRQWKKIDSKENKIVAEPNPVPTVVEQPEEESMIEPTKPQPIDSDYLQKITAASQEVGPIGAEIPSPNQSEAEPAMNVGNIDLSPVDGGGK